jgi:type IV secretion system protein VirB11
MSAAATRAANDAESVCAEPGAQELRHSVYLDAYLGPFRPWLERETVTEIIVNRPGEVWIEDAGASAMQRIAVPEVTDVLMARLAGQVARVTHQGINRESPLLAATLPGGARVQLCGPPATRAHWAMAIRRHRLIDLPIDAYDRGPLTAAPPAVLPDAQSQPIAFLRAAIGQRRTILISGGTSSGKTTFLNAMLREIPASERVVLIEDTPELRLLAENGVGLVAVKGDLGEAKVTADDLVQTALRLRPDRIVVGELRGREAVSFLRAINTGHPGSFSTVHANSPRGALEQIALMVMQAGLGLSRSETLAYAASVIDVVVQLDRAGGERRIAAIAATGDLIAAD